MEEGKNRLPKAVLGPPQIYHGTHTVVYVPTNTDTHSHTLRLKVD